MKHRRFRISDHAVLRYLERVKGINVDALRGEIAEVVAIAEAFEGCGGVISDGRRYVIENEVVVTVTLAHHPVIGRGRPRGKR